MIGRDSVIASNLANEDWVGSWVAIDPGVTIGSDVFLGAGDQIGNQSEATFQQLMQDNLVENIMPMMSEVSVSIGSDVYLPPG